jgi:hypothetical protein
MASETPKVKASVEMMAYHNMILTETIQVPSCGHMSEGHPQSNDKVGS